MDLHLDDVALFLRIVELGSLSAAARERLGPVSQVTRALARLEATCGARLLHRTTHGLSLTDEGDAVLAQAQRMLDIGDELQADLSGRIGAPSGWVRVSVSAVLAEAVIAPSLPALYERHPDGHGVLYSGTRRPLLNVTPDHRPWGFVADTWLRDWLERLRAEAIACGSACGSPTRRDLLSGAVRACRPC